MTTAFEVVHQYFVHSRFPGTKNPGAIRLPIINECAIRRGNSKVAKCHTVGSPTESRHRPEFIPADSPHVIDFLPVGRKRIHSLVPFVSCQLQRLTSRSQHEEYLCDAAYRRDKCHVVPIGRKPCAVHRFVPLADLRNSCGAAGSVRTRPKVINHKCYCQECGASSQNNEVLPWKRRGRLCRRDRATCRLCSKFVDHLAPR